MEIVQDPLVILATMIVALLGFLRSQSTMFDKLVTRLDKLAEELRAYGQRLQVANNQQAEFNQSILTTQAQLAHTVSRLESRLESIVDRLGPNRSDPAPSDPAPPAE